MFNLGEYARKNPIATKLIGLILVSSLLIALVAIGLQLYASFRDDISELEKRLDQVRIRPYPVSPKASGGSMRNNYEYKFMC